MNANAKSILIVDDDVHVTQVMALRLQCAGYDVRTANDGITARQMADANPPDLIIADILMPVGTGFAMAFRLRQKAFNVPVIFATASKDPRLRKAAEEFGGAGFIEKPYESSVLLDTVAHALATPSTTARLATVPVEREPSPRKRILVVEDDAKIALSLSVRLKAADYEVGVAPDAMTAANAVIMLWPDLIVMDITLPDGDGCTLAEQIKQMIPASMPIIFITASKQAGLREQAREIGAAAFFEKPFEAHELLAAIRRSLENANSAYPQPVHSKQVEATAA